ncbi:MAG: PQQ-dependent sugar dehydrogenase [bacterium]
MLKYLLLSLLCLAICLCPLALEVQLAAATPLTTSLVVSGIAKPSFVTAPVGDTSRLFINELDSGKIRIVKNGALLPTPFLHITDVNPGNERGLLGLAFHPNYAANGFFYVAYTPPGGISVIKRYTVSANPDIADTTTVATIVTFVFPQGNHVGGWIGFGPDGYLYIAKGDATTPANAQADFSPYGKILRIDVNGAFPYTAPPSNPYFGSPPPKNLIWSRGFRNPWRCSFDRGTGDFYMGDVGESSWEEINYQPAASAGGENYGWPRFQGNALWDCPDPCDSSGLTPPLIAIGHSPTPPNFCSVTGGYVYRGSAIPDLQGTYFYGDYCSGKIYSTRVVGGVATEITDRTAELAPGGGLAITLLTSFGEDASGELYVCDFIGGEVFKIVADVTAVDDPTNDGRPTIVLDRPAPNPSAAGFSFRVSLPSETHGRVRVFDTSGRLIRTLVDGGLRAGLTSLQWDARDATGAPVSGGVYFLRVDAGALSRTEKLAVIR